jgi:hypothetical protein
MRITDRKVWQFLNFGIFLARVAGPLSVRYGNIQENSKKQVLTSGLNVELKRQIQSQII